MHITEFENTDAIISSIVKELSDIGIKIRIEKPRNPGLTKIKRNNKRIFGVPLNVLELCEVTLSNGCAVQVPKFCFSSISRIQDGIHIEGIFRKTGSVKKQKQILEYLEKGGTIDKSHGVLDVANLLKTFLRELPDPLIPPGPIQETLLRCLLQFQTYEQKCEGLLLVVLLLPLQVINTLSYFLQFIKTITKHAEYNLMSTENLVKVLTPTIMPVPLNSPSQRLNSHFKVIELLIENSNLMGVIPDRMASQYLPSISALEPLTDERKKIKRRSGSLNRMIHGFKKIVSGKGSSEHLDCSDSGESSMRTPTATKQTRKRRLDKLEVISFSGRKKKDALTTLSCLPEIEDSMLSPRNRIKSTDMAPATEATDWNFPGGKHIKNKKPAESSTGIEISHRSNDEEFVKIPKSEYESFKDRLISIENKISYEFNLTKLDAVKAEMGENDELMGNGPDRVQNKYSQTLHEIEKLENNERKADQLAKRLSRDLKIRTGVERSPSARKIGSLRRRRGSTSRLSRNQSWHLGQSSPVNVSTSFYPKSNLKRSKPLPVVVRPLPDLPAARAMLIPPEKPLRLKRESADSFTTPLKVVPNQVQEVWTPATEFFKDPEKNEDLFFKTPVRPVRMPAVKTDIKTPMLPPRSTPGSSVRKPTRCFDMMQQTPGSADTSQGRESIIILRHKNAGMVAQKTKLFNELNPISGNNYRCSNDSDASKKPLTESGPVKIPRVIINKNIENIKSIETPSNASRTTRRSSRSPVGIVKKSHFKPTSQSPLSKTMNVSSRSLKAKLLRADVLCEVSSPSQKPISQNNTPSRKNRTPKHRCQTPLKSPRFIKN